MGSPARLRIADRPKAYFTSRLEARGQIRGGRFVNGFTGEQFARPEALDLLRAIRRSGDDQSLGKVANSDPLNLTGIILPGPRVSPLMVRAVAQVS